MHQFKPLGDFLQSVTNTLLQQSQGKISGATARYLLCDLWREKEPNLQGMYTHALRVFSVAVLETYEGELT